METFSKFLENGGTLPEEPPVVSMVPPFPGEGFPSTPGWLQAPAGQGWTLLCPTAGWGQGVCGHPCLTTTFCR